MPIKNSQKKTTLAVKGRQTKWAPYWAGLRKLKNNVRMARQKSMEMTKQKRSWRRTKLHVKPRKARPKHYG